MSLFSFICKDVVPYLSGWGKIFIALDEMLERLKWVEEDEDKNYFYFCCPSCSGMCIVDRETPFDGICFKCNTSFREYFFGPQKIFIVNDGTTMWWVAAPDEDRALDEVISYEVNDECRAEDRFGLFQFGEPDVYPIGQGEAMTYTYYPDYYTDEEYTMWDEFVKDRTTRVIACSEW